MSKKRHASKVSQFLGYATMGKTTARAVEPLALVDVRLGVEIPSDLIFLDELPDAATAPGWVDGDGVVHQPLGLAGVIALRQLFNDRSIPQTLRLPVARA